MERDNQGSEGDFPFQTGDFFLQNVNLPRRTLSPEKNLMNSGSPLLDPFFHRFFVRTPGLKTIFLTSLVKFVGLPRQARYHWRLNLPKNLSSYLHDSSVASKVFGEP